jgi:NADH-quinone oxidoreductase subunit G
MDLVNLTINGKKVSLPRGTLVLEAVRAAGFDIPFFCYHPKLKPVGMCRMCLAEVGTPRMGPDRKPLLNEDGTPQIGMMPQPQATCTLPISEGMVVLTETEAVKKMQNGVLEFFLANHPLDCPVCDKGGECPLQDLTMAFGPGRSRVGEVYGGNMRRREGIWEAKRHWEKPKLLSELIALDRERCIQCGRCVRFTQEISLDNALTFIYRGAQSEIDTLTDPPVDSKFSGNTIDICPVGALTSRVFRFTARVWEVKPTPTVCTQCGCGCNITVNTRLDKVLRIIPRENESINECWICDRGRFNSPFINSEGRLTKPLVKRNGRFEEAEWDDALRLIAERLTEIKNAHGGGAIGGLASGKCTVEDNYAFQKLLREVLGSDHVDYRPNGKIKHRLRRVPDLYAQVENADVILLVGADPLEELPILDLRIKKCVTQKRGVLITVNPRYILLDEHAAVSLVHLPHTEVAVIHALGDEVNGSTSQWVRATGIAENKLKEAAQRIAQSQRLVILYGEASSDELESALHHLAASRGRQGAVFGLCRHEGNALGALWAGATPKKEGLNVDGMMQAAASGELKALYVMGQNPVNSYPDGSLAQAALEKVEFLVVHDLFMTETAQLADVVLPAASSVEKDGTVVNFAGVAQRLKQALPPVGESSEDWKIITALAYFMGHHWGYKRPADLMRELGAFPPESNEMNCQRIDNELTNGIAQSDGEMVGRVIDPLAQDFPFILLTGAQLYDGSRSLLHSERLRHLIEAPFVELNRDDARQLGIAKGDEVEVISPRGMLKLKAKVGRKVLPGTVFVPEHQPGAPINLILDPTRQVQRVQLSKVRGSG